MGAWGSGIRQDDFVCDVIGAFEDALKAGKNVADATKHVRKQFSSELDEDDEPLFWIALAEWTFGEVEAHVLKRVKSDFDTGRSLVACEEDQRGLSRRRKALENFIRKIESPNPRRRKPPKIVVRAPKFRIGDCLSITLANGQFGAALVLAADHTQVEYGQNLIGILDYLSSQKPPMNVFQQRKWLIRNHHDWNNEIDVAWYGDVGFRAATKRLEVIGQVEVRPSDPKDSNSYCGWSTIGEQVIFQRKWDGKIV